MPQKTQAMAWNQDEYVDCDPLMAKQTIINQPTNQSMIINQARVCAFVQPQTEGLSLTVSPQQQNITARWLYLEYHSISYTPELSWSNDTTCAPPAIWAASFSALSVLLHKINSAFLLCLKSVLHCFSFSSVSRQHNFCCQVVNCSLLFQGCTCTLQTTHKSAVCKPLSYRSQSCMHSFPPYSAGWWHDVECRMFGAGDNGAGDNGAGDNGAAIMYTIMPNESQLTC